MCKVKGIIVDKIKGLNENIVAGMIRGSITGIDKGIIAGIIKLLSFAHRLILLPVSLGVLLQVSF